MDNKEVEYKFSAKVYHYSSSPEMVGWTMVSLPKELSAAIRDNFKSLEEGWGRMKVTAKIGKSEWQTAIWFDTKQDTYLLPLKAAIRKKEKIETGSDVTMSIWLAE
ncbi:DUF1905 domain-containing protein [Enterococcus hulanensis]|uniref:DUF1905 domain-containing protein n=1 Tax=Enterococcus hulanensis TaxID=2559929 RepID=UPI001BB2D009|nr:DUF1905 domain-containing protein [Enterococcus hulanensis]